MPSNNHAKGVLNELFLGFNLPQYARWPDHFRTEDKSPQAVHDILKEHVDEDSYHKITIDSFNMSFELKGRLTYDGLMANTVDVESVTWTSLPDTEGSMGDHERLIGIKDVDATADLIIKTISGNWIGVSAKYGAIRETTLKNPGLKTLEKLFGVEFAHLWNDHYEYLEELGLEGPLSVKKAEYKRWKAIKDPRAKKAADSGLEKRYEMCRRMHEKTSSMSNEEIRAIVVSLCCPKTVIPHYRTHTVTSKSGSVHVVSDLQSHIDMMLNKYASFSVVCNGTACLQFHGVNSDGTFECVARLSLKCQSSPASNCLGHVTSPVMSRKH